VLECFCRIWLVDFEFSAPPGERPQPLCLVAREFRSAQTIRLWADELRRRASPPFECDSETLFVAYYASAEFGCFLALDWQMPTRVLDLFAEFRCLTNGKSLVCGNGLLGALAYYGLDAIEANEKEEMRQLAMRGGVYSEAEQIALLDYCETDVVALDRLLRAMAPELDLPRALLRGRYMPAAARIEWDGVPLDVDLLGELRRNWRRLQGRLIRAVNEEYGVFVHSNLTTVDPSSHLDATDLDGGNSELDDSLPMKFSTARWAEWLARNDIPWPRLPSGLLALDDDTFRVMAKQFPTVAPIHELRHTLGQLRLNELAAGNDDRNRTLLSAFRSRTGRNQPSNSRFIFGPACWLRSLIQPKPSRAIAYIDWEQQEFGIAAALSGDVAMQAAYLSGDPYLAFAKQAGAVPADATKDSHPDERSQFKVCVLAVQYGMGEESLATALGQPPVVARQLLRLHRQTYPKYWAWSDGAVTHAMLLGYLDTVFGWRIHVGADANPRSLANFPCQANGSELLRMACCLMTEAGISVCAPVHDAVLIEAADDDIDQAVADAQALMRQASEIVLGGFPLRTEAKIVHHPDRYSDERGTRIWNLVTSILADIRPSDPVADLVNR